MEKRVLTAMIILTTLVLIVCSFIAYVLFQNSDIEFFKFKSNKEQRLVSEQLDIVTNLKNDGNANKYIKTSIVCVSSDKKVIEVLNENKEHLLDIYIGIFNSISYNELKDDKVSKIKNLITNSIKENLEVDIDNVYITDLILQ